MLDRNIPDLQGISSPVTPRQSLDTSLKTAKFTARLARQGLFVHETCCPVNGRIQPIGVLKKQG
jgi:hypothetical protein